MEGRGEGKEKWKRDKEIERRKGLKRKVRKLSEGNQKIEQKIDQQQIRNAQRIKNNN